MSVVVKYSLHLQQVFSFVRFLACEKSVEAGLIIAGFLSRILGKRD